MKDFNYYSPTEVVFGKESEKAIGKLVKKYGASKFGCQKSTYS